MNIDEVSSALAGEDFNFICVTVELMCRDEEQFAESDIWM